MAACNRRGTHGVSSKRFPDQTPWWSPGLRRLVGAACGPGGRKRKSTGKRSHLQTPPPPPGPRGRHGLAPSHPSPPRPSPVPNTSAHPALQEGGTAAPLPGAGAAPKAEAGWSLRLQVQLRSPSRQDAGSPLTKPLREPHCRDRPTSGPRVRFRQQPAPLRPCPEVQPRLLPPSEPRLHLLPPRPAPPRRHRPVPDRVISY